MQTSYGRKQGRDETDLYSFDHSKSYAAAEIVASTISKLNSSAQASTNPFADYAIDAPLLPPTTAAYRPPTSAFGTPFQQAELTRPMTSVHGAGYQSAGGPTPSNSSMAFDPLGLSASTPAPPLQVRPVTSPDQQCRELDVVIHRLLEESAGLVLAGDSQRALEKAKEAAKKERHVSKQREKYNLADQINHDLTYAVLFNLANIYGKCHMFTEAINTYQIIVKNKAYPQSGRLRVNMGNIYFTQGNYLAAIKQYRICLDQLNSLQLKEIRNKIMNNISICFLKLGQYQDAIHTLEAIMEQNMITNTVNHLNSSGSGDDKRASVNTSGNVGDVQSGFNLIICYFALGDKEKMKKGFSSLLAVDELMEELDESEDGDSEEHDIIVGENQQKELSDRLNESAKTPFIDDLEVDRKEKQRNLQRYLILSARLIAPVIEPTVSQGFDWIINELKKPKQLHRNKAAVGEDDSSDKATTSNYNHLMNELNSTKPGYPITAMHLLLAKGISYLHQNDLPAAIDVFRSFHNSAQLHQSTRSTEHSHNHRGSTSYEDSEKNGGYHYNDSSNNLIDHAATNLSFLYFLENNMKNAEKYAELALQSDRYNAKALVNKANILFKQGQFNNAKELYLEAIGVEADCIEAIYNLGLVNIKMQNLNDSLMAFKKLNKIIPDDRDVLWQIGHTFELLGDSDSALRYYHNLHNLCATDPQLLAKIGQLYYNQQDVTTAFHNYNESFSLYPVDMAVLSFLGIWYVKNEMYDEAITFFEYANIVDDAAATSNKWKLMIASCYRRLGEKDKAKKLYQHIHRQDPDNVECIKYLISICKENGQEKELEDWTQALKKAEKNGVAASNSTSNTGEKAAMMRNEGRMSLSMKEEEEKVKPPATSPETSPRSGASKMIDTSFKHDLPPEQQRATINQGRRAEEDEWGDAGLDDDLLPL